MTDFIQITGLSEVTASEWDNLNPSHYPFARYAFLRALEQTGCVDSPELNVSNSGWQPRHLIKRNAEGELVAAIPAYIKRHSYGEYVFDWQWAEAYSQYGMDYYPKLLCAIPFTPATGPRLLGADQHFNHLAPLLSTLCTEQGLSGWHLNFPTKQQATLTFNNSEFHPQQRHGCQFHWHNEGFTSFDQYLTTFVSRKRKNVIKERRKVVEQGIQIERKTGKEITAENIQFFYHCYLDTYQKRRSSPYLSKAFFLQLIETMAEQMMLVLAHKDGEYCAAALYFFDETTLYGRYWGCLEDVDALHFEACYYQGIEFCIEHQLKTFDPGTQGEHKISRGFRPVLTRSVHWLQHPGFHDAIRRFVKKETQHILAYQQDAATLLPFHREHGSAIKPAHDE
jgi:predicted N-acyltransferase